MLVVKGIFFIVLSAAVLVSACSQFDNIVTTGSLPGVYDVSGTDEGGAAYNGRVSMKLNGKAIDVVWENRGRTLNGTVVNMGNHIGVSYADAGSNPTCGAMFYRLRGPNNLQGNAAVLGSDNVGHETGTRISGSSFAGEFEIRGMNPQGNQYIGRLLISRSGDVFNVVWKIDGSEEAGKGTGFEWGNILAVVFGDESCKMGLYRNDRGFFEGSEVVRFNGKIGDRNGFTLTETLDKRFSGAVGKPAN